MKRCSCYVKGVLSCPAHGHQNYFISKPVKITNAYHPRADFVATQEEDYAEAARANRKEGTQ